jgi:tripartite-type tricarboxylate transporter receptor subunit TctC
MKRLLLGLALAAMAPIPAPGHAQDYPSKPIKIIVGFAAGGGTDITARIIAGGLANAVGQQVVVENRPGGGGVLAAELAAQAAPDGYTIHLANVGALTVSPHMQKVAYDVARDFAPITMAVTFPNVLVVHPAQPIRTLADYLALAKEPNVKLAYGTSGVGGAGHLAGELLNDVAKVAVPHVAYRGGGPAMADLIGGHLPASFAAMPTAIEHIRQGRARAIAVTGPERAKDLPDVPAIAESFPGYQATNWYAFVAPARTPPAILAKLNEEIGRTLRAAPIEAELAKHGMEPGPNSPAELAAFIARESATWGRVVKATGIKPE